MRRSAPVLVALLAGALPAAVLAQEDPPPAERAEEPAADQRTSPPPADEPRLAGSEVPVPKRVRFVAPAYPAEALAEGRRGIVILEIVVGTDGRVETATVMRSVAGFDDAALAAARQWTYEPTRVDGRPVRVRLSVPITFALRLPDMERAPGVPPMVQGGVPGFPAGAMGPARVVAAVTLHTDGSVGEASIQAGDSPFAEALLQALRTWRFAPEPEPVRVMFDVEANFVSPARAGQPPRVDLRLANARREPMVAFGPEPGPPAQPDPDEAGEVEPRARAEEGEEADPEAAPGGPAPAEPAAEPAESAAPAPSTPPPAEGAPAEGPVPAPPVVEVIPAPTGAPVAPPTPPPTQPGFSAVRDVTLGLGVPDLATGRRPVVPPVARMANAGGVVEASFSVDAGGATLVQKVDGPEILREAARQTVLSWSFRRTSAERVFLVATLTYQGDVARAEVRRAE